MTSNKNMLLFYKGTYGIIIEFYVRYCIYTVFESALQCSEAVNSDFPISLIAHKCLLYAFHCSNKLHYFSHINLR